MREARAANSEDATVANNLAWMLACVDSPKLRRASEALEIARGLIDSEEAPDPATLDTLAAAQASSGDSQAALQSLERARALARERGDEAFADVMAARAEAYGRGEPCIDSPSADSAS